MVRKTTEETTTTETPGFEHFFTESLQPTTTTTTATTSLKTVEEVREALAKNYQTDYQGKTEKKGDFTYIPWDRAADLANRIFGPDGYDVYILNTWREDVLSPEGNTTYGYAATVRVIAHVVDAGQVRHVVRDGLGFNEMEFTNARDYEDRNTHQMVHVPPRAMIDASIKGAVSGALLRALVLLGDAWGLYLYNADKPTQSTGSSTGSSQSSGSTQSSGKTATEGQVPHLIKQFGSLGLTDEQARSMPYETARKLLDGIWKDKLPAAQVFTAAGFTVTQSTGDRLPIPAGR